MADGLARDGAGDGYEPRFDLDWQRGKQGQLFVSDIIEALREGGERVEVKRDDEAAKYRRVYVEYRCLRKGRWEKSGIAATESAIWATVLHQCQVGVVMPTARLRSLAAHAWRDPKNRRQCQRGSHPTKGVVVSLTDLVGPLPER